MVCYVYAGTRQNIHSVVSGSDCMDLDGNSAISEAFQADKVEKSEIVDQEPSVYVFSLLSFSIRFKQDKTYRSQTLL